MKDETRSVAIEEFVRLEPKMYSFLVDNSEYKKSEGVKRKVFAIISQNDYKDVLLNNRCIRYSINKIQSKDRRQEDIKSTKFHCLVLMTKYIFKIMGMMDKLLVIRVNYKKSYLSY